MEKVYAGIVCPHCQERSALDALISKTFVPDVYTGTCPHCGRDFFIHVYRDDNTYTTELNTPEWIMCWERLADLAINAHRYSAAAYAAKYTATMKEGGIF